MPPEIVVVGSINHDLTVVAARHPQPGETILGTRHYSGGGGKGANQAVAAARLGATVRLVGRVGDDEYGKSLIDGLASEGVDTSHVGVDPSSPTGLAVITVDQQAENTIVVSPGANMELRPEHLDEELIANATVVLAQLEVPVDTVTVAARMSEGTFILNPAPGRALPAKLLDRVDVLIPNRSELGVMTSRREPGPIAEVIDAARAMGFAGSIVVTVGRDGALMVADKDVLTVPAPAVEAVDPTGAGDAFCGAVAQGLSASMGLEESVRRAVVAGAVATTRPGAQSAMPTAAEVEDLIDRKWPVP
jgi:ribokinase